MDDGKKRYNEMSWSIAKMETDFEDLKSKEINPNSRKTHKSHSPDPHNM
jgi:hypothetical protein